MSLRQSGIIFLDPKLLFESSQRGGAFCLLLAPAAAGTEDLIFPDDPNLENSFMFAPVLRGELIGGVKRGDRRQELLQLSLGIDFQWILFELLEVVFHLLENETPDGLE